MKKSWRWSGRICNPNDSAQIPISGGMGAMGAGLFSDIALSSIKDPNTGKPYQTLEETGLNTAVSLVALRAGLLGIPIQMSYTLSKPYFRAIQEHPDWVTYPYHPH